MSRYTNHKHWLFDKNKRPYYIDDLDNVVVGDINTLQKPDGQPAHLDHAPTGWLDAMIKYGRNLKYLGLFRDFTVPLKFGLDGARILRQLMFHSGDSSNQGAEARAYYGLSKWNRYVFPPKYTPHYLGEVDMSTLDGTRETVEVQAVDGGIAKHLKARESTTAEYPVGRDPLAVQVWMDGFPFRNEVQWVVAQGQEITGQNYVVNMGIISQEGSSQGVLVQDEQLNTSLGFDDRFIKSVSKNITANITGALKIKVNNENTVKLRFVKLPGPVFYNITDANQTPGEYIFDVNVAIPLAPGETLALQYIGPNPGSGTVWYESLESTLKLTYDVTFDPTFCKGYLASTMLDLVTAKLTENEFQAASTLLAARGDIVYTSGMALRNFGDENAVIKLSWEDFYKSTRGLNNIDKTGVGMGVVNNELVIEKGSYFFQPAQILDLGVVSNFRYRYAKDLAYNSVKVGYPNQTYDRVNGRDEFNVTQQWNLPLLKTPRELDLISPVRADMYGVELTRLDLFGKDTTDAKADNDAFQLHVKKGPTKTFSGAITFLPFISLTGDLTQLRPYIQPGVRLRVSGTALNDGVKTITAVNFISDTAAELQIDEVIHNEVITATLALDDYYIFNRPAYSAISGVLHPAGAFNTDLSPKHVLINNGGQLHPYCEDPAAYLKFQSGEKNSELSTTLAGVTVTEKQDLQAVDLALPLWLNYYFEFDTSVLFNYKEIIETNPYGTIRFEDERGREFFGFLWDGGIRPATDDKQKWILLCSPQTNLKQLA